MGHPERTRVRYADLRAISVHRYTPSAEWSSYVSSPAPAAHVEGINRENRALLERLHRDLPGAFDVEHASAALGLEVDRTRKLLAYLARRGWLSRVRRGLYVAVPLDTRRPGEWVEDPWVVADRIFSPCYIGGWSACQHWSLTDQVFRTILVVTGKKVRSREPVIQGTPYRITVRSEDKLLRHDPGVAGPGSRAGL